MIENENLIPLVEFPPLADLITANGFRYGVFDNFLVVGADSYVVSIKDALIENYLDINLIETASSLALTGSELVAVCFERNLLQRRHLAKLCADAENEKTSDIFMSFGQIKLLNLICAIQGFNMLFQDIRAHGFASIGPTQNTLRGHTVLAQEFDRKLIQNFIRCMSATK